VRGLVSLRASVGVCGPLSVSLAAVAAVVVVIAFLAAGPSTASAVIVHLPEGHTLSYQPAPGAAGATLGPAGKPLLVFDEVFGNVDYSGGPVMTSNTNYALYWDPSGGPAYPYDYQPGIDRYFEDLAHDSGGHENTDSVSTQYDDSAGEFANYDSHFGGALIDTDPYPANGCDKATICLTDAQIRAELVKYTSVHGLPTDLVHEYFVLTPPGAESCFEPKGVYCSGGTPKPAYCAYHSNIPVGGEGEIVYADNPYVDGTICDDGNHPNGTTSDATLSAGLSHEHNESITDPEPDSAWTEWETEEEIADKCRTFEETTEFGTPLGTAPDGAKYNQVINGHLYWYQQLWSNQDHECLQRFTLSGAEPTATFTYETTGDEAFFDASASTAPGGVARYEWQFNDPPEGNAPVESASPMISHTFPASGAYTVALTVFASDGTSIGTARTVTVGSPSRPTVTKVSPGKGPPAGDRTVTIAGTGFAGVSAVDFGAVPAAEFEAISPTSIVAVSPAQTAETVDVTVTTPPGSSAVSSRDRFKVGPPTVTDVSPATGPLAGETTVKVTGTGFAPGTTGTSFKFGSQLATSVSCASITTCTVLSPSQAKTRTVDVRASVKKSMSKKNPPADRFTYK
jgi:hypothetical protein